MYDFGTTLSNLRKERGLTQAQLARKLNKSAVQISRYESNQRIPTLDVLISISLFFNVSLDYLAGLEKQKTFSTEGLDKSQMDIINTLILDFHEKKYMTRLGLTKRQMDIINNLLIEFNRGNI